MKIKSLISKTLICIYPLIILLIAVQILPNSQDLQRGIGYLDVMFRCAVYWITILIFIYMFLLWKKDYGIISAIIGLVVSILIIIPGILRIISIDLDVMFYDQFLSNINMIGIMIVLYISLIIKNIKKTESSNYDRRIT